MVHLEIPKDEKTESLLDSLSEHLVELKEEASEIRKQGTDTTMLDLLLIDVPSKIKFARATYEQKDIDSIKNSLAKIRHEIDILKTGTDFDDILNKIETAYQNIREEKYRDASEIYNKLRDIYKSLPEEMRRIVYAASLDIHKKILEAEKTKS